MQEPTKFILPKRIVISGYYGFGNIGDEAILDAMIQQLREQVGICDFTVVSGNPAATKSMHAVNAVHRLDYVQINQVIDQSDLVIIGGGGLFQDIHQIDISALFTQTGFGTTSYAEVPLMAAMHQKPIMFYAQGFGPLFSKEAKTFVAFVCGLADMITTRDYDSKKLLEEIGVPGEKIIVCADPALSTAAVDADCVKKIFTQEKIPLDRDIVAVSVRRWVDKQVENHCIATLAKALDNFLHTNNAHLIFLPFQDFNEQDSDVVMAKAVVETMHYRDRCHCLLNVYSPQKTAGIIHATKFVIGMRLHAMIFAARYKIPMVALCYDPKVQRFMHELNLNEFCFDLFEGSTEALTALVGRAWKNQAYIQQKLSAAVPTIQVRNSSAAIAHMLLGGPKPPTINVEVQEKISTKFYTRGLLETIHRQAEELRTIPKQFARQLEESRIELARIKGSRSFQFAIWLSQMKKMISPQWWKSKILQRWHARAQRFHQHLTQRRTVKALTKFLETVNEGPVGKKFVVIFSGTKFVENEGQRPMRIAKEFARRGNYVLFTYLKQTPYEYTDFGKKGDHIFLLPLHQFTKCATAVFTFNFLEEITKILLIEFPHASAFETISLANGYGWITVYDVLDDWEEFSKVGQAAWYDREVEEHLVRNADIIACVCSKLMKKHAAMGASEVILLPNALDPTIGRNEIPRQLKRGKITLGYFGYLADSWFDWNFILDLASQHQDWIFHFIGYGAPTMKMPANVILHGKVEPQELFSYARNWDVAIIPFTISNLSANVDPIKIYEYLFFGLPVVVRGIPHVGWYPNVYVANTLSEFVDRVEQAIHTPMRDVHEFLEKNSWENCIDVLEKKIMATAPSSFKKSLGKTGGT